MTTVYRITDAMREVAGAVIAAEDRADELIYAAGLAFEAGRWADAADLLAEAVELYRYASETRAEVGA